MVTLRVVRSADLRRLSSSAQDESAIGPLKYVYLSELCLFPCVNIYILSISQLVRGFG